MEANYLELKNITKKYPGVIALDDVSVSFKKGEVHALIGENGAGKSTFIKTITGAINPNKGQIIFDGQEIKSNDPLKSQDIGIAAIYQEFNLFPDLTIAENIFHGSELKNGLFVDYRAMEKKTKELLSELGIKINPKSLIKDISVSYQQIVEIAKALSKNVKVLIMDEPSAALSNNEINNMFRIINKLKENGVTIVYISHRLEEIFEIADRVTVLRDGKKIRTMEIEETDRKHLINMMVGRKLGKEFPQVEKEIGETILKVNNLSNNMVENISFELKRGEILGFAGLVGSGRTEIARSIFGADDKKTGDVYLCDEETCIMCPEDSITCGIGLIPENRKQQGLLLEMDIKDNICFSSLNKFANMGLIKSEQIISNSKKLKKSLNIKTPSLNQLVKNLSGGNQQKVVLAKWLLTDFEVLIFDEPTRGIDVGAKQEIYNIMNQLAKEGKGIIMISSEMSEILGMSDKIMVMHEGKKMGELNRAEATQEKILEMASGSLKEESV